MKNRRFKTQKRSENHRKLDAALRRLTGDRLTYEQRRRIRELAGSRQCAIRLIGDPSDLPRGPTTVYIYREKRSVKTIFIYLGGTEYDIES